MYDGYFEQQPVESVGEGRATLASCNVLDQGVGGEVKHIVLCRWSISQVPCWLLLMLLLLLMVERPR